MSFILLTLSFMLGSLLASGVAVFIIFKLSENQKFMNWYLNWFKGIAEKMEEIMDEIV